MKIIVNTDIKGYRREEDNTTQNWSTPMIHAEAGDTLRVIFTNPTHYICESKTGKHIVVFFNQCKQTIVEKAPVDDHDVEKYYNMYEEPSKTSTDDPFYSAFEYEDELLE